MHVLYCLHSDDDADLQLGHFLQVKHLGIRRIFDRSQEWAEYLEHYHRERPHAGLDGAVIEPDPLLANRSGAIIRKDRLGGLLTMYHRVAA
mgnify:CR=1 FL=1